ncbi:uncharacterized protein LOC112881342 [Panicum hallii]|uniref:uncharacterized protein LOC112881342 n=1 Tax=Panicum hallii TaxID=206008 RepID=UPI000DF4D45D|nr:uncharacterized protein LOC112881342 [Panicum hallii]
MARQLGVAEDSRLWVGVLKLVRSEEDMESFEEADEEGRKCILAHLSGEADEPSAVVEADAGRKQLWEQDFFGMLAEEDHEDIALIYGKFYLVDSGYPNRPGYQAPYKGTMYHIQDFQNVAEPRDQHVHYVPPEASIDQPETVDAPDFEDVAQMNAFRDYIADHLYNRA